MKRNSLISLVVFSLGCFTLLFLNREGSGKEPSQGELAFFEKEIRPLLADKCWKCHGELKQEGGLRLDSREAIFKGGKRGPAADNSASSLLFQAVVRQGKLAMPPNEPLAPVDISRFKKWIALSLPWTKSPGKTVVGAGNHWAFQPLAKPIPPATSNPNWPVHPIDSFILDKLLEKNLSSATPASKGSWLRRVFFDLTGLPPSPFDVEGFLSDSSPNAKEKVIDRLLASPNYGEKWGRHWLDLARYSDSNGMDENLVQGNAWRYRDYVIEAMNRDIPFQQLVQQHVAGDLLPNSQPEGLIATGFLSLGPKMLAEDDPVKMQMDIVDEQIDTVGKVFLGMTMGCARCHDHKYDPFTMADYYSLAGVFKSTSVMENYRVVARWVEKPVGQPAEVKLFQNVKLEVDTLLGQQKGMFKKAKEELQNKERKNTSVYLQAARDWNKKETLRPSFEEKNLPANTLVVEAESYKRGNALKSTTGYGEKIGVIYNAGELPNWATYDVSISKGGPFQLHIRYAAMEARPFEIIVNGKLARTGADKTTGGWYPKDQKWELQGILSLKSGSNQIEFRRQGAFPHLDKFALTPAKEGEDKTLEQFALEKGLVPQFVEQWSKFLRKTPPGNPGKFAENPNGAYAVADNQFQVFSKEIQRDLEDLKKKITEKEKELPSLPEAMAATDSQPVNLRVHLRGNHLTLGEEVHRGVPPIFHQTKKLLPVGNQSGRMDFALWLSSPDNALAWRVIANRLWNWHFNKALVRTPDNFGILGDTPSHPELLDWLAQQLIHHGGSFKSLHRDILLSQTYAMASGDNLKEKKEDPDNRFFWSFPRRRLGAEEIRDAILANSGLLEQSMGGSLMKGKNRGYVPGYPNGMYEDYHYNRRSVYLPVIRSMLYDLYQTFDFPDPSMANGERVQTTIALQGLFSLNSKIMADGPAAFAQSLRERFPFKEKQVTNAIQIVYSRNPTAAEIIRGQEFLNLMESEWMKEGKSKTDGELMALQGFIRVLLSSNEFLFLE